MEFNLAEKLAIVKSIDRVILADQKVRQAEMVYLGQLMKLLDFDSEFVEEARRFNISQANLILAELSEAKRHSLGIMLHEMAYADGEMDPEEIRTLFTVFETAGIKIEGSDKQALIFDIADVYFKSSRNIIYNRAKETSEEHKEKRAVKIEPHIEGKTGFTVSIFKLNGLLSFWGYQLAMPPMHMQAVNLNSNKSYLKSVNNNGSETPGNIKGRLQYGLSIFHPDLEIEKICLHQMHNNTDIEFLK